MTTNNLESFNNVFKGIRSRTVAGIVEYSFGKCNKYFINRWQKARNQLDNGQKWGLIADEHLKGVESRSVNQLGRPFSPERMIYEVRGAGGTNIGGESHGGRKYKVDIRTGECTCMTPQLLHMPCFHLVTACMSRGISSTSPTYLSPFYARSNTIKVWESSFEPYLDPSHWPESMGLEYVPDSELLKPKKGRKQKKPLKGDMDEAQGRGSADYGTGDFDQEKTQNRCSKYCRLCSQCTCRKKKKCTGKKTAQLTVRDIVRREV